MDTISQTARLEIAVPGSFERLEPALRVAVLQNPQIFGVDDFVSIQETHFSWIVTVGESVYKLKKPLCKRHLDFSTVQKRGFHCRQELILNRRFTDSVYLGLKALTVDVRTGFSVKTPEPSEKIVDWMIHMRRLDPRVSLKYFMSHSSYISGLIAEFTRKLGELYQKAQVILIAPQAYLQILRAELVECERVLSEVEEQSHQHNHQYMRQELQTFISVNSKIFEKRVCQGKIIEAHGDLRPEHIFFEPKLQIIDCLEFSLPLRCRDMIDELAYLAVECEAMGREDIGEEVLDTYASEWEASSSPPLRDFYTAYRALVRAKLAAWRYMDTSAVGQLQCLNHVHTFLKIAEHHVGKL